MEPPTIIETSANAHSPDTPSPTALVDAVPENAEVVEADNGKRNVPDNGQEETQALGQMLDLSKSVVSFLNKLEPLKVLMSTELQKEMEDVAAWAQECTVSDDAKDSSPSAPHEDEVPLWDFEIREKSMSSWRRSFHLPIVRPVPLLETYYSTLGPGNSLEVLSSNFSQTLPGRLSDSMPDQKNLQRIKILSHVLASELELLTSTTIPFPVVIAPPYKLLLEYLPQMKIKLSELRHELAEATLGPGTIGNEDTTSDTAEKMNSKDLDGGRSTQAKETNPPPTSEAPGRAGGELRVRITHLETLTKFIDKSLGDLVKLRAQIADGTLDKISFDDLWHLFRPGDLVLSKRQGRQHLFKVHFVTGGQMRRRNLTAEEERTERKSFGGVVGTGTRSVLKLDAFNMNFDGSMMGPEDNCLTIKHYTGKKPITDLPVFPVRFHPQKDELLARLEERGRKFMSSTGHRFYDGSTVSIVGTWALSGMGDKAEDIVSEVFVDHKTFFRTFEGLEPDIGRLSSSRQDPTETSEFLVDNQELLQHFGDEVDTQLAESFRAHNRAMIESFEYADEPERMTAEHFQLLPQDVPAYCFRYRRWYFLDVDLIQPIDPNRYSGFDDLVIPTHYKELLVALVDNHTSGLQRRKDKLKKSMVGPDGAQIDLVTGKGQGLIILLHGPPGSGKTSTAETIAAHTQRPLYSITCGDIGLEPQAVEKQLGEHAARADKWGCVLLLDEADVFLMQRTWKEVDRNALVSVFLRQLEYYSGILFLTTNRPGTIDEAFKSRIHLSLRYPSIDLQSTKQMWENIMRRLETENERAEIRVDFDRRKLLAFAEQHYKRRAASGSTWNGRQIRNAFQTALALGHADRHTALGNAGKTPEWAAASGKKRWMTVKLTAKNFRRIGRVTTEFEDYIVALRGKDSDTAREAEVRDDDYDPGVLPARKNYGAPLMRRDGWAGREPMATSALEPVGRQVQMRKRNVRKKSESEDDDEEEEDDDDDDDDDEAESDEGKDDD